MGEGEKEAQQLPSEEVPRGGERAVARVVPSGEEDDDDSSSTSSSSSGGGEGSGTRSGEEENGGTGKLWQSLCLGEKQGLFYESGDLSLTLKHEYRGIEGRIAISFENKSRTSSITNLGIDVVGQLGVNNSNTNNCLLQIQRIDKQVKNRLGPGERFTHYLVLRLVSPFIQPPKYIVKLGSSSNGSGALKNIPLLLPVTILKFGAPLPEGVAVPRSFEGVTTGGGGVSQSQVRGLLRIEEIRGQGRDPGGILRSAGIFNVEKVGEGRWIGGVSILGSPVYVFLALSSGESSQGQAEVVVKTSGSGGRADLVGPVCQTLASFVLVQNP